MMDLEAFDHSFGGHRQYLVLALILDPGSNWRVLFEALGVPTEAQLA